MHTCTQGLNHLQLLYSGIYLFQKNVVGENGDWQLSNGDCTTERKCGFLILMVNNQLSKLVNDARSI